jgi:hypothetical protein
MAGNLQEFEDQLQQEELVKDREEQLPGATDDEFTVDGILYRKDPDGIVFEFDPEKRAWFPKIDEDFIANYQMNYGTDTQSSVATSLAVATKSAGATTSVAATPAFAADYWTNPPEDINSEEYRLWYEQYCNYFYPPQPDAISSDVNTTELTVPGVGMETAGSIVGGGVENVHEEKTGGTAGKKRKKDKKDLVNQKPAEPPAWFELEDDKNTNVYVSGLPEDVTEDEYKEFMSKVGVVAFDPILRKPKLKLYTNADGTYKGDGRCCYIKPESVDLALQILDGADIRGHIISVEHARFELKGQYDPSKKRRKMTKQEKKKFREKQEKILGWQPEKPADARPRHERVVVIKHAFKPEQFEKEPQQLTEISADFREECKKYGDVRKVTVYDRHPEGVVTITFRQPEEADLCIAAVNRRWFAGQILDAANWDGKTKYLIKETQEEMEKRISQWHNFLEEDSKLSATDDGKKNDGKSETESGTNGIVAKDVSGKTEETEDITTEAKSGGTPAKAETESEKVEKETESDAETVRNSGLESCSGDGGVVGLEDDAEMEVGKDCIDTN